MTHPGRWISLLPILALVPRLGLVIIAADRQQVAPETRAALLWISSTALAVLVGLAEVYVGSSVVSRRHGGLAAVWVAITVLLNALIVPLSLSGLEAAPLWNVLGSRLLEVAWSAGLGILSTLCVCGCLWADVVREGSGLAERYEAHLLGRISDVEAQRDALEAEVSALRAQVPSAASAAQPAPRHSACRFCGYTPWQLRRGAGAKRCGLQLVEALRAEASSPQLRTSYLATRHVYYETAIDLLMARHRQAHRRGFAARALALSEQARARSLLDMVQEARVDRQITADPLLAARFAALQERLNSAEWRRLELARTPPRPRSPRRTGICAADCSSWIACLRRGPPTHAFRAARRDRTPASPPRRRDPAARISPGRGAELGVGVGKALTHQPRAAPAERNRSRGAAGPGFARPQPPSERGQAQLATYPLARQILAPVAACWAASGC